MRLCTKKRLEALFLLSCYFCFVMLNEGEQRLLPQHWRKLTHVLKAAKIIDESVDDTVGQGVLLQE